MEAPEKREGLSDWGVLGWGILIGVAVVALLVAAYVIGAEKGRSDASKSGAQTRPVATQPAATQPGAATGAEVAAAATFSTTCGGCHTLSAAGTSGTVGPNLDDLKPSTEQVVAAIENGGAGSGQMPAGLLADAQAQNVAAYVSSSAGSRP